MEHWYSFLYLYVVGGMLFGLAIALGIRKRVLRLERAADRRILVGMIGTYLLYFTLQGVWNILAVLSEPGLGG